MGVSSQLDHGFSNLWQQVKELHDTNDALRTFCEFPSDTHAQEIDHFHVPAADLLYAERGFGETPYAGLRDALIAAGDRMKWRETYKGSRIAADFMARFGCYEIIGRDAPFRSKQMRSFVVYQPPNLHYPWHQHPAEEIYVVLAGRAEFHLENEPARELTAGDSAFHPSNRAHALTTHEHPVMAYVVWRNEFDTVPVWSDPKLQ